MAAVQTERVRVSRRELAALFLRLGFTAFGGPAAHIAIFEEEVVRRRRWLSREEFLDLLGAANLLPGPTSTELALFIGRALGGGAGLLIAGIGFCAPALLLTVACAWAYGRGAELPSTRAALAGVEPVVVAAVAHALWRLGRTALKTRALSALAAAAAAASLAGAAPLVVLVAGGLLSVALSRPRAALRALAPLPLAAAPAAAPFGLLPLFGFFFKTGAVLFGGGYVLLAFLQDGLVARRGWLTSRQVLDAVAVGQLTPGPVFSTAAFIGYVLGGGAGAAAAAIGIFLPAFVFVAASGPLIPRLRGSKTAAAFLDGVNAAALGLLLSVLVVLGRAALIGPAPALIAAASLLLLALGWNAAWLVPAGALAGLLRL
jgi:chromate transporter